MRMVTEVNSTHPHNPNQNLDILLLTLKLFPSQLLKRAAETTQDYYKFQEGRCASVVFSMPLYAIVGKKKKEKKKEVY